MRHLALLRPAMYGIASHGVKLLCKTAQERRSTRGTMEKLDLSATLIIIVGDFLRML